MTVSISRAQFLRGDFNGRRGLERPPWANPEALFAEQCTACGACRDVCHAGILQLGRGGYPRVDFSRGGCDFCGACAGACTPGALNRALPEPWHLVARIQAHCLSLHGVLCRICGEHCEARAIRFQPTLGGRAQPHVEAQACTGCGACYAACPSHAIVLAEDAAPSPA